MATPHGAREAIDRAAAELAAIAPFSELAPVDRARLAAALEEVRFKAGDLIFEQGARADALYILREGLVERRADGLHLDTIHPPAVFGDLALLRDEPRATTLAALTDCLVWRLPADRFKRVLRRTPGIAASFAATVSGRLASRQVEVAELSSEFEGMAEHLYSSLTPAQQETLERAALLPVLDERVLGKMLGTSHADPMQLPLAGVLLDGRVDAELAQNQSRRYPPVFRRFLLRRMTERVGPGGVANTRRELAALARSSGATDVAVQTLLEGELVSEAVELVDREVDSLRRANRLEHARQLARLLPLEALQDHPHLHDLAGVPTSAEHAADLETRIRWRLGRPAVGALIGIVVILGAWRLPPPEGLSERGWHALVTLIGILPLLALEVVPDGIVALLLAAAWVVGGVTAPRIALGGFATTNWVLVVTALAVGSAIASSGLLYRMALWTVAHSRGGFPGQAISLGIAGMMIGPAVPNATSRVALVAPAATELIDALGYPRGSRPAIGMAMAILMGFGQIVAVFLTSSTTSVLVYAVLPEAARASLNWGTWFARGAPTHLLLFAGLVSFIIWRYRPRAAETTRQNARHALALQQALLGRPSRQELIALGITIFVLVGFATQPIHHLDPAWVGVLALAALAGTGVLTANGLSGVNWSFALLSGILTSMSDVFADTGLDTWLGNLATHTVGGLASTPVLFVAALTLVCYAFSLVMRWQAAAPLLTISLAPVAASAGIDPWVVALIALVACNGFFLPYQSTTYLALYHGTNGRLFSHPQARPMAIAYGVVTLLALCASVPVWRLWGLL
ncbi:MAG TPA: SLC13 family permease [Chloroflexota bacterium]|nr:SLC13 family permease [Chloroflexota bacterium]